MPRAKEMGSTTTTVEMPVYIPDYNPQEEKLPTLKQWIKKWQHEEYKFNRTVYPISTLWAVGSYGTASIVTSEFRIGFKCSPTEFERIVSVCDSISRLGYKPVVKVDRDSSPGWSITGNAEKKADCSIEAIQRDDETIGYAIRDVQGNEF